MQGRVLRGIFGLVPAFLVGILCASCDPVHEIRHIDLGDVRPPQLSQRIIQDNGLIRLDFDEAVSLRKDSLFLNGTDAGVSVNEESHVPGQTLLLSVGGSTVAGRQYSLELTVEDAHRNSLNIVMPFYGLNPAPAELVVNEIMALSSTKNSDTLELYVTHGGNAGGITVFLGVPDDFDAAYILPPSALSTGDYVLLHCKPQGIPEEKDETGDDLTLSGGKNTSALARDLWWHDAPGLPDSSGIVCIASSPIGRISDAVFYSDKITVSGKDYRSFGTKKLLDRAEKLQASGSWYCKNQLIAVEDAARSDDMTATRTLCRSALSADTNAAGDWHVVPSGQATLGSENSQAVYSK